LKEVAEAHCIEHVARKQGKRQRLKQKRKLRRGGLKRGRRRNI